MPAKESVKTAKRQKRLKKQFNPENVLFSILERISLKHRIHRQENDHEEYEIIDLDKIITCIKFFIT